MTPQNKSIDIDECIYITQTFININNLALGGHSIK